MDRLKIARVKGGGLAVICQSETLDQLSTRFVVPLINLDRLPDRVPGLHPEIMVEGRQMVLATHLAGALSRHAIEQTIDTLDTDRYVVQRALDMLTGSGF